MCMGAISHARIKRLVFGAFDPKRGAVCHALSLSDASFLNHRINWVGGVLEKDCSELLSGFFRATLTFNDVSVRRRQQLRACKQLDQSGFP